MFRTIANKLLMVLYFVLGALILEAFTFYILDFGFMPEYFWYNFSLILVVAIAVFIIPNFTAQYTVYTVILGLQAVLIYINYSLTKVYGGELLSIEMVRLILEAGAAMTSSFVYFAIILELILIYVFIALIGGLMLKYCKKDPNDIKQHFSIFSIIIILSVQLFGVGFSLNIRDDINASTSLYNPQYSLSDEFKMNSSYMKSASYAKFGTYGYFTNMIINAIRNDKNEVTKATLDYFNSGNIYDGTFYNSQTNRVESNGVFGIDKGNNVIVFMMESLEWFGFGDGKYDPTFENLIYVDDQLGEEKTFTPNITKLLYGDNYLTENDIEDDALRAKNFFAKSKTNMSEGQAIIGNYPVAQSLSDVVRAGTYTTRSLGYSMPNVLRDMGYNTAYIHSHDIDFYSRGKTHKYLGFDTVVGKNSLSDENGNKIYTDLRFDNWAAEGEFVGHAIDYIVPNDRTKPFYSFYLNVSSHGAYTANDNKKDGDAIKYYDYIKYGADDCTQDQAGNWHLTNTENPSFTLWYSNALKNHPKQAEELVYYQCGVKGLDDAVGIIVNKLKSTKVDENTPLEEKSLYDETTMLFYSDHNAYYDDLSHNIKGLDPNNNNTKELNIIPMFIVSPGLREYNTIHDQKFLINDRFTSAYDIVPTLFDLLGVKFNENLYLGHSLFRPSDYADHEKERDIVVYYSNTGGLYGDNIYTFNLETFITSENYTDEVIEMFKSECANTLIKINFLGYLNRYNLYHKLTNV